MIYWFLQFATYEGAGTRQRRERAGGAEFGEKRSPGGSSLGPGSPPGPWKRKAASDSFGGAESSQSPLVQVPAHSDFPPPPLLSQFFLQVTFSCVAAASCRVASTNCLVLSASSLLLESCPGISYSQEERFAVSASSPRLSPLAHPSHLGFPIALTFSIA